MNHLMSGALHVQGLARPRYDATAQSSSPASGWIWARLGLVSALRNVTFYGLLFSIALFSGGFFAFVASLDRYETMPKARGDGIVVLTGGSQRIEDGIELLAKGYGGRLLISGVNEKTSLDEIAKLNPGQRVLLNCCVDLDYRARNTIGNAIEARRWIHSKNFSSVIVVTSHYHMPRTLLELRHAMPGLTILPYAVVAGGVHPDHWWNDALSAKVIFLEYVKFLAVWARTALETDPEGSMPAALMSGGAPSKIAAGPHFTPPYPASSLSYPASAAHQSSP
jgi:uncharacterized SAM-binding protein YcdF (DUF218 family)